LPLSQPEVPDKRFMSMVEKDVSGFQITMKDALVVGIFNGEGDLCGQKRALTRVLTETATSVGETSAGSEFHRKKGKPAIILAHVIDRHDIGMI
jgi:hypothetical protein